MKYIAFIYKDPEDSGYTAVVPDLSGCMSEGGTFEEACAMIQEAAELWLEGERFPPSRTFEQLTSDVRQELMIPEGALTYIVDVKQDKNVRVNVVMSAEVLKAADEQAALRFGGNRSAYLQELVRSDTHSA
ncbi:MAG: type II toxin-antitoxin system HicB family antitoxin [Campylobacterales bacterium]|nr:type II toxin-antitoxin system HicB family antitoxin [Campylobacterales bacterium]